MAADPTHRLHGRSRAVRAVRERLRRVGPRDAPVLVLGESGTGKEVAARLVHELSTREGGPFLAVDCGAFQESLLESELFGHARGAFTGAESDRRGLFEEADGGTIFLDEIANTTPSFQARLLRTLQEGEVRPVGCNRPRRVDVRIVTATNRDLVHDVETGRFRQDLLYRLDVLRVVMPPLRRRREDLPALVQSILTDFETRTGDRSELSARAMAALSAWHWPGNVRELRNVLECASATAPDGRIDVEHLPGRLRGEASEVEVRSSLSALLAEFERTIVREGLEKAGWNRTRAAQALGITRRCLFNKIAKHGLGPRVESRGG